jgi:phage shock protein C
MSIKSCPFCAEEIQVEAVKCKHCGSWLNTPVGGETPPQVVRLTRSSTDRMIAGVCGGLARQVGLDPTIIRVAVALLTLFTALVPGLIAYLVFAIVLPVDSDPRG